jgi:Uma2 family endonuclease
MVDAIANPYVTFAEYLEAEQASDVKREWFNGAVYAILRGTPEHARLTVRIMREISLALDSPSVTNRTLILHSAGAPC